tara:strand:- start:935 stop:1123 length:189 start_codon:yes stop_codon:yes gene_type:complete
MMNLILGFMLGAIVAGYVLYGKYKNLSDILMDKMLVNKLLKEEMRKEVKNPPKARKSQKAKK